ncbi:hypothetical protein EAY64_05890 [Aquitalea palustris]|uniref:Uncharacterized protein n=1 Tax=Aquitalea palustris TaxID=2480983 RepID=A0A454JKV6_9NEIS|nr:hypothetical protein EAY64_05890 [Aquitalea palustris]
MTPLRSFTLLTEITEKFLIHIQYVEYGMINVSNKHIMYLFLHIILRFFMFNLRCAALWIWFLVVYFDKLI